MIHSDNAPILEFDPARDAVLEPHLAIKPFDLPAHVVLCFFRDAITAFVEELGGREIGRLGSEIGSYPVFEVKLDGHRLAISQAGWAQRSPRVGSRSSSRSVGGLSSPAQRRRAVPPLGCGSRSAGAGRR